MTQLASHSESQEPASISHDSDRQLEDISLLDILVLLAERKRLVIGTTLLFTICASLLAFVLPKRYTANVVLLPPQQNMTMSGMLASQLGAMGGMATLASGALGIKNPNDMYVAMLKSRTVEDAMVHDFGLALEYKKVLPSDARKAFERHCSVDGNTNDNLIHISVEDRDPKRAAQLANGYVDEFRKLSETLAITEASRRRLFFEQELEQTKDKLASAEESFKETEQKTGIIQLDSQARALIESAASLRAQIVAKEVEIQSLRTFATDQNAELVQAQNELDSLRTQLSKLGGSESGAETNLIVPKGKVPEAGLEYVRRLRDVKYEETIFDILARQFEVAKLDEARQGALIQVVDSAVIPDKRSFPQRGLIIFGSTGAGFLLGIVMAILFGLFERAKQDPEVMQKLAIVRGNRVRAE